MKNRITSFFPFLTLFLTSLTFLAVISARGQVPSYVPTNGLVGYWPFNGNANDESGNGNNGTVNGATLTEDRYGEIDKAYSFDGISNVINIFNSSSLSFSNTITIGAWVFRNSSDLNLAEGILGPATYLPNEPGYFLRIVEGKVNLSISQPYVGGLSNQLLSSGQWYFVSGTYDNNSIKTYVNGVLDGENIVGPDFLDSWTSSNPLTIGQEIDYASPNLHALNGKIDDIGIWNRALTADEVLALYNGCNVTPQVVSGNTTPGAFANSTYTCNNNAGSTYSWTVNNGVIVSGQGTNSVNILWGAEGAGSVSVTETTADGCVGDAVVYDVNVQCVVSGNAITGPVGPEAFSNSTYTCNGAANSTYNWSVTNGVIASGQGTNTVNILWASTGIGNVSVVETTAEGCVGVMLSQDVVVVPVNVEELSNALILYPNPATTNLTLQVKNEMIGSDFVIYDALGKVVMRDKILSSNQNISINGLSNGNYILRVGEMNKVFTISK